MDIYVTYWAKDSSFGMKLYIFGVYWLGFLRCGSVNSASSAVLYLDSFWVLVFYSNACLVVQV